MQGSLRERVWVGDIGRQALRSIILVVSQNKRNGFDLIAVALTYIELSLNPE